MSLIHNDEVLPAPLNSPKLPETHALPPEHAPSPQNSPAPPDFPTRPIKRRKTETQPSNEDILNDLQPSAPKTNVHARSYRNLHRARADAATGVDPTTRYSSSISRQCMTAETIRRCARTIPKWFQTDVGEAFLLGMDVIFISGTGTGKTLGFLQALLNDEAEESKILIISPLNLLQYDIVNGLYSPDCFR